jgi:hypothetical protein
MSSLPVHQIATRRTPSLHISVPLLTSRCPSPYFSESDPLWVERVRKIIGNPMLNISAATLHKLMAQIASLTEQVKNLNLLVLRQVPGPS